MESSELNIREWEFEVLSCSRASAVNGFNSFVGVGTLDADQLVFICMHEAIFWEQSTKTFESFSVVRSARKVCASTFKVQRPIHWACFMLKFVFRSLVIGQISSSSFHAACYVFIKWNHECMKSKSMLSSLNQKFKSSFVPWLYIFRYERSFQTQADESRKADLIIFLLIHSERWIIGGFLQYDIIK